MTNELCEWCGKKKGEKRWACKSCSLEDMEREPQKAYLVITNMVCDEVFPDDIIEREALSSLVLTAMRRRYRCPVCFAELPNHRVQDAGGSMENVPGACPKCGERV